MYLDGDRCTLIGESNLGERAENGEFLKIIL